MEIHQWIPLDNIKIPIGMTRMDEDVESATLLIYHRLVSCRLIKEPHQFRHNRPAPELPAEM